MGYDSGVENGWQKTDGRWQRTEDRYQIIDSSSKSLAMRGPAFFTLIVLLFGFSLLATGCDESASITEVNVEEYFNAKGRYPRFANSKLVFGDTLTQRAKEQLGFTGIPPQQQLYRKAAYRLSKEDSIIYLMYGVGGKDSILQEVRVRSLQLGLDSVIGDHQLIDLKKSNVSYDYWFPGNEFVVIATDSRNRTHHSIYRLQEGHLINKTFIPDTVFRRQDLFPDLTRMVNIYDDFATMTLSYGGEGQQVSGQIVDFFCDDECREYMIIDLLGKDFAEYPYLLVERRIFNTTLVFGTTSKTSKRGSTPCMRCDPRYLKEGKQLLQEVAYIEYQ